MIIVEGHTRKTVGQVKKLFKDIPSELSFDWMSNGNTDKVATSVLLDAIKESPELPAEIKQLIRVSRAQARKYVALKIKNMI